MANKTLKTRILLKTDTKANWEKAAGSFIPKAGEVCIYSDRIQTTNDEGETVYIPGIKVGDGVSYIDELEFMSDEYINKEEIDAIFGGESGGGNTTLLETYTLTFPDYDDDTYNTILSDIALLASNSAFCCNTLDSNGNLIRISGTLYELLTDSKIPIGCTSRSIKVVKDTALTVYGDWLSSTFIAPPATLQLEILANGASYMLNSYVVKDNITLTYDGPV